MGSYWIAQGVQCGTLWQPRGVWGVMVQEGGYICILKTDSWVWSMVRDTKILHAAWHGQTAPPQKKKLKMYIKTSILDEVKNSLLQWIIETYLGHVFLSSSRLLWQEAQLHHSLRENLSSNFVLWAQSHTASGPTGIRTGTFWWRFQGSFHST